MRRGKRGKCDILSCHGVSASLSLRDAVVFSFRRTACVFFVRGCAAICLADRRESVPFLCLSFDIFIGGL